MTSIRNRRIWAKRVAGMRGTCREALPEFAYRSKAFQPAKIEPGHTLRVPFSVFPSGIISGYSLRPPQAAESTRIFRRLHLFYPT